MSVPACRSVSRCCRRTLRGVSWPQSGHGRRRPAGGCVAADRLSGVKGQQNLRPETAERVEEAICLLAA